MEPESWIYIAILGGVIAIFAFIMPKQPKQTLGSRKTSNDEIEQLELSLGQFMDNMEKQHDELVQVLSVSINQMKEDSRQQFETIKALESKCTMLEDQISTLSHAYVALETKYQITTNHKDEKDKIIAPQENEAIIATQVEKANSIHSRYLEIFELYESGKSIEFIAKKVGKNKGEVQLIIQLAKKEETSQNG